jgi:hypothetical protein
LVGNVVRSAGRAPPSLSSLLLVETLLEETLGYVRVVRPGHVTRDLIQEEINMV